MLYPNTCWGNKYLKGNLWDVLLSIMIKTILPTNTMMVVCHNNIMLINLSSKRP